MEENLKLRLLNGEKDFTEDELSDLIDFSFEDIEGEEGRWTRYMESIVECEGRLFSIYWERGLTEYQENTYSNQPVEVELVQEEVTIVKKYYKVK